MVVSGVEGGIEVENIESDDFGGKEVFVGNVSGDSVMKKLFIELVFNIF